MNIQRCLDGHNQLGGHHMCLYNIELLGITCTCIKLSWHHLFMQKIMLVIDTLKITKLFFDLVFQKVYALTFSIPYIS